VETLTLPAQLESLDAIAHYVLKVSQDAGVSRHRAYKFRLAVDELVTNIIVYGCANLAEISILEVRSEIDSRSLKIIVSDTGIAFDPTERVFDRSLLSKPIEERPIGGLGIFLALQNVDEFSYQVTEKKNISTFSLNLQSNDPSKNQD